MGMNRMTYLILALGDISTLYFSVWVTMYARYFGHPDFSILYAHLYSFTFLFIPWFVIYVGIGLYGAYTFIYRRRLSQTILTAQSLNMIIAAVVFFTVPIFHITPKTILVVYLIVSTMLLYIWRVFIYPNMIHQTKKGAVCIGDGEDIQELASIIQKDSLYPLFIKAIMHPSMHNTEEIQKAIRLLVEGEAICALVVDMSAIKDESLMEYIYETTHKNNKVLFVNALDLYEEVFERLPLSMIDDRWALENVSLAPRRIYGIFKRIIDIVLSIVLLPLAALLIFFSVMAIKIEDGGPVFISQKRKGKGDKNIYTYKLRTMTFSDAGVWIGNSDNKITKVGSILRKTHIDELPQILNVLGGSMSFVGPRPDIVGLYNTLVETTPLYSMRYLITPGITGWAQAVQIYDKGNISPQSFEETKVRLQYDLYYVKNRSLLLDIKVVLLTVGVVIKTMFVRNKRI